MHPAVTREDVDVVTGADRNVEPKRLDPAGDLLEFPAVVQSRLAPVEVHALDRASACQTRAKALSLRDCPNVVFASARAIALDLRGLGGSPANHARHFSSAISSALVRTPDGGRSPPAAVSFLPCAAYRCSSHQS